MPDVTCEEAADVLSDPASDELSVTGAACVSAEAALSVPACEQPDSASAAAAAIEASLNFFVIIRYILSAREAAVRRIRRKYSPDCNKPSLIISQNHKIINILIERRVIEFSLLFVQFAFCNNNDTILILKCMQNCYSIRAHFCRD